MIRFKTRTGSTYWIDTEAKRIRKVGDAFNEGFLSRPYEDASPVVLGNRVWVTFSRGDDMLTSVVVELEEDVPVPTTADL